MCSALLISCPIWSLFNLSSLFMNFAAGALRFLHFAQSILAVLFPKLYLNTSEDILHIFRSQTIRTQYKNDTKTIQTMTSTDVTRMYWFHWCFTSLCLEAAMWGLSAVNLLEDIEAGAGRSTTYIKQTGLTLEQTRLRNTAELEHICALVQILSSESLQLDQAPQSGS